MSKQFLDLSGLTVYDSEIKQYIPTQVPQADWTQKTTTAKDYIKNKPTLGTAAAKDVPSSGNASSIQVVMGDDTRLTDARPASDVSSWAKASTKPTYTKSEVGLGNVGNFKAVSTEASQGLSSTEQANARANIGAGTSSFSGSYNDLSNKPTLGTAATKDIPSSGNASTSQVVMGNDSRLSNSRPASDVSAWAKASTKPTYTASEVGLGNVGNYKAVSTVANQGLTSTEQSNARANIGAGTSSFSGSYNDLSNKPSLGTAAAKNATTSVTSGSADLVTSGAVYTAIDNLPEPMVFKGSLGTGGTITELPAAATSNTGFTYKVITAGTYAEQSAKIGDTFISDGAAWWLIPSGDEPSGTVTSVTIKGTSPIVSSSSSAITTSGTRTISHATSGVTAGTYKSVTVDTYGHVTAGTNPTTLAGYGITDAKIASGVITLGGNTITPLTSHQDISGKADKSATVSTVAYDTTNKKITKTINGTTSDVVTAATLKTDMELNNVGNFKAVSTVASQGLSSTEKSNARANIGAGTSSLTLGTTSTTALKGDTKYAGASTAGGSATSAAKLDTATAGSATQPCYFANGVPSACTYTLEKSVPSNAVFTDTNTKVTSVGNHYTPAEDTSAVLSADASSTTAATWNSTSLVTGVDIKRDAKGHVVGVAVDSIKMPANPNSNTTYTFANGTNGFTVTPSGGSAQTVTVTPSITNNVTGSGTSGYIAKFNGANTITNGPAFGSATTTYLRNDGSWATPPNDNTKNTAGSTDTSSKIFLVGATSQAANPQTYSDNEVFATNGVLTTKSVQVGGGSATMQYNATTQSIDFVFA